MKSVNIMNFARSLEPRSEEVEKLLLETTRKQLLLVNELQVEATFLLQYDVYCNEDFVKMIKSLAGKNIELGFWYEVVEPLTTACGLPYESKNGWKWDWHIKPGFSMSYSSEQRIMLIDEAMRKFHEVFGYYPKTIGSWLLDTKTVNYLASNYDIDAMCFCRDQINTDAYTLVGGYFNQAYYPSKNNMFTPANSDETQIDVPVFRLLGPDPIHNYDNEKYASPKVGRGPFSMEVALPNTGGGNPRITDWYLRNYFENESLGFAYMQIGQENSFNMFDIIEPLRYQIKKLMEYSDVAIEKMCVTGQRFKEKYKSTPPTALCALDNWDSVDAQSIYYDSKHYTANLFRHENKVFIRSLYLFDDGIADVYNNTICDTYDAIYENMPIVDTIYQKSDTDGGLGIILDTEATNLSVSKISDDQLKIFWNDKTVIFTEDRIFIEKCKLSFTPDMKNTVISVFDDKILFEYKSNKYVLLIQNGACTENEGTISISGDKITLIPSKI